MYQKILILLDGSKRAERILAHATGIAKCTDAEILLLHVVELPVILTGPYDTVPLPTVDEYDDQVSHMQQYLDTLKAALLQQGLTVTTIIERGSVVSTIQAVAREKDVDLIAMASHGRSGLSQVFYGSVAAGVLNRVERPLLVIRSRD